MSRMFGFSLLHCSHNGLNCFFALRTNAGCRSATNPFGLPFHTPGQKFVCTTIRPTLLPYPELYEWEGCARFVADHITYEPLEDSFVPVCVIISDGVIRQPTPSHL